MKGNIGIVTALHGVLGAKSIVASNAETADVIFNLSIEFVDIEKDIAVLQSDKIINQSQAFKMGIEKNLTPPIPMQDFNVIGHPKGAEQYSKAVKANIVPTKKLVELVSEDSLKLFNTRKSPDTGIDIINLDGNIVEGYSGAPVLDRQGKVIGVISGGIPLGAAICWAIPIKNIHLLKKDKVQSTLNTLAAMNTKQLKQLFGVYLEGEAELSSQIENVSVSDSDVKFQEQSYIWVTYAPEDDQEGDFSYLIQELEKIGIKAKYDKVALIPGRPLWEQIGEQITKGKINGWAYLLTPKSLSSKVCREQLAYALDRALEEKGTDFPLIGLLHGVKLDNVPPALKVRGCINLSSPNWKENIKASIEGTPPPPNKQPQGKYVVKIYPKHNGDPSLTVIEIRPHFEEIMYWRLVLPVNTIIKQWGPGPSNEGTISGTRNNSIEGTIEVNKTRMALLGTGDKLSSTTSAYFVISGPLPDFIFFGSAKSAFGDPNDMETIQIK